MLLLIDNYDSFTYNLFQLLAELGAKVEVVRNDQTTVKDVERLSPERIVISPGPSVPANAGISKEVVRKFHSRVPMLGVCLGHQCIVEELGGEIERATKVMHGKTSRITHDGKTLFAGLPNPLNVVRYHSLMAGNDKMPPDVEVSARSEDDSVVMAVRHTKYPLEGLQFHPESHRTEQGRALLENFLKL